MAVRCSSNVFPMLPKFGTLEFRSYCSLRSAAACLISFPIGISRGSELSDFPAIEGTFDFFYETIESFARGTEREIAKEASLAARPSFL